MNEFFKSTIELQDKLLSSQEKTLDSYKNIFEEWHKYNNYRIQRFKFDKTTLYIALNYGAGISGNYVSEINIHISNNELDRFDFYKC